MSSWFDTNRPGFWGTFPPDRGDTRGSDAVRRGRRPFARDSRLSYEEDSDEEWEDEDPGESLSNADEEEEVEELEGSDVEEGFVVPDGHISDDECVFDADMGDEEAADMEVDGADAAAAAAALSPEAAAAAAAFAQAEKYRMQLAAMSQKAFQSNKILIITCLPGAHPLTIRTHLVYPQGLTGAPRMKRLAAADRVCKCN